jgi:flagellar hook-associated protein 3 FlgL
MSFSSIGDLSASFQMRYFNATLRRQANQLGMQLATGKHADVAKSNKGDMSGLAAMSRTYEMITAFRHTGSEMETRADVMQNALQVMQTLSDEAAPAFQIAATSASNPTLASNASAAESHLATIIGALNTNIGGQYLFAGQAYDQAPVIDADAMLTTLQTLTASASTAADVNSIVTAYFGNSGGYEIDGYTGSPLASGAVRISDSETVGVDVTAFDTEFRDLLQGFASAALLNRGILGNSVSEQAKLMANASAALSRATPALVSTQSEIGSVQERIEAIQVRNQSQASAVQIMLNEMTQADPYETATALQAVEGQLEALYISTSRLSQLSLTRYLR